jgi:uncharacterized protein (TIGR00270 family)
MDCELCGKPATAKGTIEGVSMQLCNACAKHGTNVRGLPPPKSPKRVVAERKSELPREELIEKVRDDVGKLLREHRMKLGLNHEQFAAKLQMRASTYHHFENGTTKPDTAMARKLEHILKLPIVVHVKMQTVATRKHDEPVQGLTIADMMRKR